MGRPWQLASAPGPAAKDGTVGGADTRPRLVASGGLAARLIGVAISQAPYESDKDLRSLLLSRLLTQKTSRLLVLVVVDGTPLPQAVSCLVTVAPPSPPELGGRTRGLTTRLCLGLCAMR